MDLPFVRFSRVDCDGMPQIDSESSPKITAPRTRTTGLRRTVDSSPKQSLVGASRLTVPEVD
jgi:hypothetical protein